MIDLQYDSSIEGLLAAGSDLDELPELVAELARAERYLRIGRLLRGSSAEVAVRVHVLRSLGREAGQTAWSLDELRRNFPYLRPEALDAALTRLRECSALELARGSLYQLTSFGLVLCSDLHILDSFEDADDLGLVTGSLALDQSLDLPVDEALSHLEHKLEGMHRDILAALESRSEFRLLEVRQRLEKAWRWMDQATEVVRQLAANPDLDLEVHRQAQRIGLAQGRLTRAMRGLERALAEIDRQRVYLGQSGLSTRDVVDFFRSQTVDSLVDMLARIEQPWHTIQPHFALWDVIWDQADYELSGRGVREAEPAALPAQRSSPEEPLLPSEPGELVRLMDELGALSRPQKLEHLVPRGTWEGACYRLSMLSLLGHDQGVEQSLTARLARLPLRLHTDGGTVSVGHSEVAEMSSGQVVPLGWRDPFSRLTAALGETVEEMPAAEATLELPLSVSVETP
ncbi:MAG TPA: hypothetical protein VNO81_02995 [Candidatus Nitrosotenuis sp.]|nr:hypothetical protein [Candidatus Nitrosotenuis sp.]